MSTLSAGLATLYCYLTVLFWSTFKAEFDKNSVFHLILDCTFSFLFDKHSCATLKDKFGRLKTISPGYIIVKQVREIEKKYRVNIQFDYVKKISFICFEQKENDYKNFNLRSITYL